jgi:hypothetical protein
MTATKQVDGKEVAEHNDRDKVSYTASKSLKSV